MRKRFVLALIVILVLIMIDSSSMVVYCNTEEDPNTLSNQVKTEDSSPFNPNDILMYYPSDWNDTEVVDRAHVNVIGSSHDGDFSAFDSTDDILNACAITTDKTFEVLQGKEAILNVNGEPLEGWMPPAGRILSSIHYPGFKENLIQYAKELVDRGVDILAIDGMAQYYTYLFDKDGGDFSEYSLKNFRNYLALKYSLKELSKQGITDIEKFDYAAYIRKNYMELYQSDRNKIPFFIDFRDFQFESCKKLWSDVINQTKKYAADKGRKIFFTNNTNDFLSEMACSTMVDAITSEYVFGYPPKDKVIPFIKLYNGLGKKMALVDNCGFCTDILSRPDSAELMKIYTAEAYASGGYAYVPYGSMCLNEKGQFQLYYADMKELYPYYDFIHDNSSYYNNLEPISPIGVYYSFASVKGNDNIGNEDTYQGISNLLIDDHQQFEVIFGGDGNWIQDKLTFNDLAKYSTIVVPNAFNMSDKFFNMLLDYVKKGGNVIAFGKFAASNEKGVHVNRPALSRLCKNGIHKYGLGQFIYIPENIGHVYYSKRDDATINAFENVLNKCIKKSIATNASRNVAIQPYYNSQENSTVIHLINYDYDLKKKSFNSQNNIKMNVTLDKKLQGKELEVTFDSPDEKNSIILNFSIINNILELQIPKLTTYGVLYIGEKGQLNAYKAVEKLDNRVNELKKEIDVTKAQKTVYEAEKLLTERKYANAKEISSHSFLELEAAFASKRLEQTSNLIRLWDESGRNLDFIKIKEILNAAIKANSEEKYEEVFMQLDTAAKMMNLAIDGSITDWNGLKPLSFSNLPRTTEGPNINEMYVTNDDKYIYFAFKILNDASDKNPDIHFNIDSNNDGEFDYNLILKLRETITGNVLSSAIVSNKSSAKMILPYNICVIHANYYEFKIPSEFIKDVENINFSINSFFYINRNCFEGSGLRFDYKINR